MTVQDGGQNIQTKRIALQFETTGIRGTTPSIYMIAGDKFEPSVTKPSDMRRAAGNRDPILTVRQPDAYKASIPLRAIIEANGLGEMVLAAFGTDTTSSQLGSSGLYDHVFTANDTILTFTRWLYNTLKTKSATMCVVDALHWTIDRTKNSADFVFDEIGAGVQDDANYGATPSYADLVAQKANLIPASQAILEYGQPQSAVSQYWEKIDILMKENAKHGAPGKGVVPTGQSIPRIACKGDRDTTIQIDFIDQDYQEYARWYAGGDVAPTATAQQDVASLVKFRLRLFGSLVATTAAIWGYAHQANTGLTLTWGGTYSASPTTNPSMFEVVVTATSTMKWRQYISGAWSAWTTGVTITGASQNLTSGVTVTFSAASGGVANDTYYGFSHYQRMIEFTSTSNVVEDVNPIASTDFYRTSVKLFHESGPGATKPSMTLRNTKTPAYA